MIELTTIEGSSQLVAAGFDPAAGVIRIRFQSGGVYDYAGATQKDYDALMAAESKGRHFGAHIRGKFAHTKVVPAEPEGDQQAA